MRYESVIPADVSEIEDCVRAIMSEVARTECGRDGEFAIEIALREALANAILHGAKGDATKKVEICVACESGRGMLIVIRDPGEGFDPEKIASPIVGERIYADHGRGIFLINELMDEVRYEKGGTEIHMIKRH